MAVLLDPDELAELERIWETIEKLRRSDIKATLSVNNSQTYFNLKCKAKLFKSLTINPESLELPNASNYYRPGRTTVEKVGYIESIKESPIVKVKFELDLLTGKGTLSFE